MAHNDVDYGVFRFHPTMNDPRLGVPSDLAKAFPSSDMHHQIGRAGFIFNLHFRPSAYLRWRVALGI